uniref:PDZ domain-containing protein n=1 Tax=Cyprinus carpio TaxID=7962 RepID=A0A8C2BIZ3_CYPCA
MNPGHTVIVIRSLVAGGLAERDGRLLPGDRLMFVNGTDLSHASLDQAVRVLKSTALGIVRIGVTKPLMVNFSDPFTISSIHKSNNRNLEQCGRNLESEI